MDKFNNGKERLSIADLAIITILLFGLYSGVFIYITPNLFIPYGLATSVFPIIFIKSLYRTNISELIPLILIIFLTFLSLFFVPFPEKYLGERFKGLIQLMYTFFIVYYIFKYFQGFSPILISKIFFTVSLLILIGTFLENNFSSIKDLSDSFRFYFFKQYIYTADPRDISLFGSIRPRLFTKEPSHVAKFLVLSLFIWFSLTKMRYKYFILVIFSLLGLLFIKSPIIILIYPLAFLIDFYLIRKISIRREIYRLLNNLRINLHLFYITIILSFLSIILLIGAFTILQNRIEHILSLSDLSFLIRIYAPPIIGINIIKNYPLLGIGITGKELLVYYIKKVFLNFGFVITDPNALTNVLWLTIIYYGIIGTLIFIILFQSFLSLLKVRFKIFTYLTIFLFSQTMGGFVSLRWWFVVFMIILVVSFRSHNNIYIIND